MGRKRAMLAVVEDVYNGGSDLIPNWKLLRNAQRAARQGGVERLYRYCENLVKFPNERAVWVRTTLERHGRKTLESEWPRLFAAYNNRPLRKLWAAVSRGR